MGKIRINNVAYCDDLILISLGSQMRGLINICEEYGKMRKINYNPKKSVFIKVGNEKTSNFDMRFKINNENVPEVQEFKYSGLNINNKLYFNKTILEWSKCWL